MLLALVRDPHFQEVPGEHVALEQEVVVLLQVIQGFAQAPGHIGHLGFSSSGGSS